MSYFREISNRQHKRYYHAEWRWKKLIEKGKSRRAEEGVEKLKAGI